MLPRLRKDADGGLTRTSKTNPPATTRKPTGYLAPKGPFFTAMRPYWLKVEAIEGKWTAPPLKRVQ